MASISEYAFIAETALPLRSNTLIVDIHWDVKLRLSIVSLLPPTTVPESAVLCRRRSVWSPGHETLTLCLATEIRQKLAGYHMSVGFLFSSVYDPQAAGAVEMMQRHIDRWSLFRVFSSVYDPQAAGAVDMTQRHIDRWSLFRVFSSVYDPQAAGAVDMTQRHIDRWSLFRVFSSVYDPQAAGAVDMTQRHIDRWSLFRVFSSVYDPQAAGAVDMTQRHIDRWSLFRVFSSVYDPQAAGAVDMTQRHIDRWSLFCLRDPDLHLGHPHKNHTVHYIKNHRSPDGEVSSDRIQQRSYLKSFTSLIELSKCLIRVYQECSICGTFTLAARGGSPGDTLYKSCNVGHKNFTNLIYK